MQIFFKSGRCKGLKLFKFKSWQVEFWFIPKSEKVPPHTHPNVDSWLLFLCGSAVVWKEFSYLEVHNNAFGKVREKSTETRGVFVKPFKTYFISSMTKHWFSNVTKFCVFLNFQHWLNNTTPTSASVDFKIQDT